MVQTQSWWMSAGRLQLFVLGVLLPVASMFILTHLGWIGNLFIAIIEVSEKASNLKRHLPLFACLAVTIAIWLIVGVGRLHDMGWSGHLILLLFVPVANIVLIMLLLTQPGFSTTCHKPLPNQKLVTYPALVPHPETLPRQEIVDYARLVMQVKPDIDEAEWEAKILDRFAGSDALKAAYDASIRFGSHGSEAGCLVQLLFAFVLVPMKFVRDSMKPHRRESLATEVKAAMSQVRKESPFSN